MALRDLLGLSGSNFTDEELIAKVNRVRQEGRVQIGELIMSIGSRGCTRAFTTQDKNWGVE